MFLKLADKLVKQGDLLGALQAIAKAKEFDPQNRYADAYEERVIRLLRESGTPIPKGFPKTRTIAQIPFPPPPKGAEGMPSAESQLNTIARVLDRVEKKKEIRDPKNAAIVAKIASLVTSANQLLGHGRYGEALNAVARALLLDPNSGELRNLEEQIRASEEDARVRSLKRQEEKEREERRRRERILQQEVERLKTDQEQKRKQEENQRRAAHEQKIAQSIQHTRDFLASGYLDEAQCELAFVSVLAPGSTEVIALEAELARRQQERERAAQEAQRRQLEEQRQREYHLRRQIERSIKEAESLAQGGQFDEALRVLTDAYLLDPNDKSIQSCEDRILVARAVHAEKIEEERRAREEARLQAEAAELAEAQARERTRIHEEEQHKKEDEREAAEAQIATHLLAARTYLADNRIKEALAEVALGFIIDPFHTDVKAVEELITDQMAQNKKGSSADESENLPPEVEADIVIIAKHLVLAKQLASQQRYLPALHEVERALAVDPESIAAKRLAASLKQEFQTQEELRRANQKSHSSSSRSASSSQQPVNTADLGFGANIDYVDQLIRVQLDASSENREAEKSAEVIYPWKRWWFKAVLVFALAALLYIALSSRTQRPPESVTPTEQVSPSQPAADGATNPDKPENE
jgi:hypothetical protein